MKTNQIVKALNDTIRYQNSVAIAAHQGDVIVDFGPCAIKLSFAAAPHTNYPSQLMHKPKAMDKLGYLDFDRPHSSHDDAQQSWFNTDQKFSHALASDTVDSIAIPRWITKHHAKIAVSKTFVPVLIGDRVFDLAYLKLAAAFGITALVKSVKDRAWYWDGVEATFVCLEVPAHCQY